MATPQHHRDLAEAYFVRLDSPGRVDPDWAYQQAAEVHAILATRAGADEHYVEAEEALENANGIFLSIHTAKMHALLAAPATATEA